MLIDVMSCQKISFLRLDFNGELLNKHVDEVVKLEARLLHDVVSLDLAVEIILDVDLGSSLNRGGYVMPLRAHLSVEHQDLKLLLRRELLLLN